MQTDEDVPGTTETTDDGLLQHLTGELRELERLCSAIPQCDATGKLWGKLTRLHDSLRQFQATGDLSHFRDDIHATEALVRDQHSRDALTQLLGRLSALSHQLAGGNSHAGDHRGS